MRRVLLAGLIAVCLALCAQSARGDDAQSLLAKNKAFAGWVFGDPSMGSLRLTGTIDKAPMTDLRRGAIWRRTSTNGESGLSYSTGYTGQRYWYANENGFIEGPLFC